MTSIKKRILALEETVVQLETRIAKSEIIIAELESAEALQPQKKVDWTNTDFMKEWQYGEEVKK